MRVATWNVNNIHKRLPQLVDWLQRTQPDVVALQELKCTTAQFPTDALQAAGYGAVSVGQRTWNGVALLARGAEPCRWPPRCPVTQQTKKPATSRPL